MIVAGIIFLLLTTGLAGFLVNYRSGYDEKDHVIDTQKGFINYLNSQIANQTRQIEEYNNTILSLTDQVTNLTSQVNSLNSQTANPKSQTSSDASTIANLQSQLSAANSQINNLNSQVTALQGQVNNLTSTINANKPKLQTLVFHVCEKGDGYEWGHLPDASATYSKILALNNNYDVLLLPEYQGNTNWTEELAWLTANFGGKQGIPIMLDVFGGGNGSNPTPMLSTSDILSAMAVSNVQYLRFSEAISWHMDHPELPFPVDYVNSILEFCRANNLKLFWTEWKAEAFPAVQTYIKGYEDIVTVSFSTNCQFLEPFDGFQLLSNSTIQHWGSSVQAWYWDTRHTPDPLKKPTEDMPIGLLIQHALLAKSTGAEIIQFEPYWYFFDKGQANDNLRLLETIIA